MVARMNEKKFTDEEEQLYYEVETSMMNYLSEKELKQIDEYEYKLLSKMADESLEDNYY